MARSPEEYRRIGPLVAAGTLALPRLPGELVEILRIPPTPGRLRNALQHLWGYVSEYTALQPDPLDSRTLLEEIGHLAREHRVQYLLESTAFGELRFWCEYLDRPLA